MSEAQKKAKSSPGVLVARIAIFGGLGILLALAFVDFRMKRNAEATSSAIRKAIQDKGEMHDLTKSELSALIQGSPVVSQTDPRPLDSPVVRTAERYEWRGMFRTYIVTVGYSLGTDPAVEIVEGPGPPTRLE